VTEDSGLLKIDLAYEKDRAHLFLRIFGVYVASGLSGVGAGRRHGHAEFRRHPRLQRQADPQRQRGDASGGEERKAVQRRTSDQDRRRGKASFEGVPYGKLRIQVLATGFQTFGDDYSIDKPTVEITVKMKRPQGQYSIYEDHPGEKKDEPDAQPKPK